MDDINKNIEEYNPSKKCKILIVFDNMIGDTKKLNPVVTELFIRGRKQNIYLVFILQSYSSVPKNINSIKTKFYALLYYENSKQTTASTNRI